jgi:hypothetical protein
MLLPQLSCRIRNTALTPLVGTLSTHHNLRTRPTRIPSCPTLDRRPQSYRPHLSSRRLTNHTWARPSAIEPTQRPATNKLPAPDQQSVSTSPPTPYRVSQQAQRPDAKLVSNSTSRGRRNTMESDTQQGYRNPDTVFAPQNTVESRAHKVQRQDDETQDELQHPTTCL